MPTPNEPAPNKSQPPPAQGGTSPGHTPEELDELLDEALDETFPASDPPAVHRRPD